MDIPNTIKKIRKAKGFTQTEVFKTTSNSKVSRIENNVRDLRLEELNDVIKALTLEPIEFYHYASLSDFANSFSLKLRRLESNKDDEMLKQHMLDTYYLDEYKNSNQSNELAYYYSINFFFSDLWNLQEITKDQKDHIFNHLLECRFYGCFEYLLYMNMITVIPFDQGKRLTDKMYPIKDENLRDPDTLKYARTGLLNLISQLLYNRNYREAKEYIELAGKVDINKKDYYFRFSIQYLKNIVSYCETEDTSYLIKATNFIELLKDTGDLTIASLLEKEMKQLISTNKKIGKEEIEISIVKDR